MYQFTYYNIEDDYEEVLKLKNFHEQCAWWRLLCKGRDIPYKDDIQFKDLLGWHADLMLSELADNDQDIKYIIIGENVKKILGPTIKQGSYTSDLKFITKEMRLENLRQISSGKTISFFKDDLPIEDREYIKVEALLFPFSDKNGKCSHFITFYKKLS